MDEYEECPEWSPLSEEARDSRRADWRRDVKPKTGAESGIGSWPDPDQPGVPLHPERGGVHWMRWRTTGSLMIGQWDGKLQMWVISYLPSSFGDPWEMEHLDYVCEAEPPKGR
jgi:hypothetical protein